MEDIQEQKSKTKIRTYSELIKLSTFRERFEYLKLLGTVAEETFGYDRYLNQRFYRSSEWKRLRDWVFLRDGGNDLALEGYPVNGKYYIHHMNPIRKEDILDLTDWLMNPEYLITTRLFTHNAIHYGNEDLMVFEPVERKPNDTKLW